MMPSSNFPKKKVLHSLAGILSNQGPTLGLGNSAFIHSSPFSALTNRLHPLRTSDIRAALSLIGTIPLPSVIGLTGIVSACASLSAGAEVGPHQLENVNGSGGQVANSVASSGELCYGSRSVDYCRRVSESLKHRDPLGNNMIYKCFPTTATSAGWKSCPSVEPWIRESHPSCSVPYPASAAPKVSLVDFSQEDWLESPRPSSDQKLQVDGMLKLLSGSSYLPHPDKETGGEDAHFICIEENVVGVANGVGEWTNLGVDAGWYARELMSHSVSAIQEEPKGSVDPARVLKKAYSSMKSRGSSTACIIALNDQGIHAVNHGDSGFIVVRDGCTIFGSPVQQNDLNITYPLESGNGSDLPSSAQVVTIPVSSGDVIIAGTDGLFDNLHDNEVAAAVVHAIRAGLAPQVAAQKIAALARQRAQGKTWQTPFSTRAQDADYHYHGGKLDDITVIVSYVR